jgi:hypothetical protein
MPYQQRAADHAMYRDRIGNIVGTPFDRTQPSGMAGSIVVAIANLRTRANNILKWPNGWRFHLPATGKIEKYFEMTHPITLDIVSHTCRIIGGIPHGSI